MLNMVCLVVRGLFLSHRSETWVGVSWIFVLDLFIDAVSQWMSLWCGLGTQDAHYLNHRIVNCLMNKSRGNWRPKSNLFECGNNWFSLLGNYWRVNVSVWLGKSWRSHILIVFKDLISSTIVIFLIYG